MIIFLFVFTQSTLTPTKLYNQANEYYAGGDYAEAIEMYEQAASQVSNAKLFYNLGNSYFKSGKIGKAILNFRKARLLAPRDSDIKHNLAFARNYRVDKIKAASSPITRLFSNLFHFFSMYEAQILTTILFIITAIFISLYIIFRKNIYGYVVLACAVLCILFFINWYVWIQELNARHAVVLATETTALSGPGEDYKEILVIHDGIEVSLRERRGIYALIQLPGGMGGWVPQNTLEEIY
jgi:tetratricopeptide (TPR) repeat protein